MTITGYQEWRAAEHEDAITAVVDELRARGRSVVLETVDGHRPDMRVDERLNWAFVDVKTSQPGKPNIAIELDSMDEYRRMCGGGSRVYIVHIPHGAIAEPNRWTVDTPDSLTSRIVGGGPKRRSGNGSLDDWYLIRAGGTPFDEFFSTEGAPA